MKQIKKKPAYRSQRGSQSAINLIKKSALINDMYIESHKSAIICFGSPLNHPQRTNFNKLKKINGLLLK